MESEKLRRHETDLLKKVSLYLILKVCLFLRLLGKNDSQLTFVAVTVSTTAVLAAVVAVPMAYNYLQVSASPL